MHAKDEVQYPHKLRDVFLGALGSYPVDKDRIASITREGIRYATQKASLLIISAFFFKGLWVPPEEASFDLDTLCIFTEK